MKTSLLALLCLASPLATVAVSADPPAVTPTARALESAKRIESQSHLKQLSLAAIMYMQDHDEVMPDAARWMEELSPYLKSQAMLHDPAAPTAQKWCYAYNRTLSHKSVAALASPATTVLFFETTKNVKNASDTGQSVPHPGRHSGGTDFAFTDGHVKWFPDGTKLSYALSGR